MPGRGWARHGDGEAQSLEPSPEGARRRERPRPGPSGGRAPGSAARGPAALPRVRTPGPRELWGARCEAGGYLGVGKEPSDLLRLGLGPAER